MNKVHALQLLARAIAGAKLSTGGTEKPLPELLSRLEAIWLTEPVRPAQKQSLS